MKDLLFNFVKQYKYHFLVWGIYNVYEIAITGPLNGSFIPIGYYFYYCTLHMSFFYFHANILLKYALEGKRKFTPFGIVILVFIELILFIAIKYGGQILIIKYVQHNVLKNDHLSLALLTPMLYRSLYFMGYSTGYYFLMRTRRRTYLVEEMKQQELKDMIQEKEIMDELIATQNAFLKSQINPEFLINTLEYLYQETHKTAPKAAENIVSLSAIMQYALSEEALTVFVKLEKEIELIENFLLLHQAKQVCQAQLKLSYTKEVLSISFIPLILMTLTENILKHGKLDDPDKAAELKITCENSILRIETTNKKSNNSNIPSHGIGLKNIKDRLSMTYGETASFEYYLDSKGYFYTIIEVCL